MENVSKAHQWYDLLTKGTQNVRPVLLVGLGLVVVLGGLAGLNPLIGIIGAVGLLLLAVVVSRPILIVYALTLTLPLVGGLARGVGVPFLRLGQALLVLGFILFLLANPSRQGKFRLTAIDLAFVIFFLTDSILPVLALQYRGEHLDLNSTNLFTGVTPLQTLLGPLQYYVLYRIVVATVSSEKQIKTLLNLSFVACIVVSVIGILQKLGVGPVRALLDMYYPTVALGYTVSDLELRATSTLGNYGGLAAYLSFTMIVALACYVVQKQLKFSSLLLAAVLLLGSITLILTGTFAAGVGLAIGAVIVFRLTRRLPKLVIFILVGIALALFIFQPFISDRLTVWLGGGQEVLPTYAYRIMLWKEIFLPAIGQHLLFGAGPAPAVSALWPSEETQYFAQLLRGGLPDLFAYFLLIGVAIAACWRQIKCKRQDLSRLIAITLLAILVALSVMNLSAVYFSYAGPTQTLWTLLAIVVASGQLKAFEQSAPARPLVDGNWRTTGASFDSYVLIPNSIWPAVGKSHRDHRPFAWLERILDWHFVKDSVVVSAGFTISRLLGLLFWILLAHFLAPDSFGFFRYSIAVVASIIIASTAGPVSIARFLAANPNNSQARDRYFSNGLVGIVLLLAFSLLISIPILWLLHTLDFGAVTCAICLAIFYGYFYIVRGLSSAWKMSLVNVLSNVALIVALIVVLGLFRMRTATTALAIYGLTNVAPILVLELVRPVTLRFRLNLVSKSVLLELTRFAMPIVLSTGAFTIWFSIDVLLIGNFNPHAAGSYAAAKTLAQAFIFVPSAITMVLMPKVAALELNESKRYISGAVLAAFLTCLVGFVIVYFWGHTLISLTFGQRYSDAYLPLLALSAGMSFYSFYIIVEGFIIGRGQPNLAVKALLVALVGTTASGFWLTSHLGPLGAGLSFTIGAALGAVAILFGTWRFLRKEKHIASNGPSNTQLAPDTAL